MKNNPKYKNNSHSNENIQSKFLGFIRASKRRMRPESVRACLTLCQAFPESKPSATNSHLSTNSTSSSAAGRRLRREPMERIFRIHDRISAGEFPNRKSLCKDFGVSLKTIKRDLEFMRDHYDLPICFDRKRRGFYYSRPVDSLPGTPAVSEAEMFAFLIANKAIGQYSGTPFHQPLQNAFQKMSGQLDTRERYSLNHLQEALSFRPLAPEDADLETFQTITRAVQQNRILQFQYRKLGDPESGERLVHPYHLTCIDNRWYVLAFDIQRMDIRTFALGRITSPIVTDERFEKPANFDPAKYLEGSFTVMKGEGDYSVVIEFDAWAADLLRGRQWHPSQKTDEMPNGACRIQMRLSGLEEIERWVLSWGNHAKVLAPLALVDRIITTASAVVAQYKETASSIRTVQE